MHLRRTIVPSLLLALAIGATTAMTAGACASFDESPEGQPAGSDAATEGAVDGTVAGNDAASACAPEPIEPTDAGPEDAHCGANGIEINIATSDEHCGFCGHTCAANNACANGACTTDDAVPVGADNLAVGAAADGYLYFTGNGPNCDITHVKRTAVGQEGAEDVITESTTGCLSNLIIANGFIYYSHGVYGLRRTPLADPVATTPTIVPESEMAGVGATSTALFTFDKSYGRISQRALDGQFSKIVHEDLVNLLSTFGADGSSIWWTTQSPESEAGPPQVTLWGLPPGASSVVKRASDLPLIRTFALDDEYIYLASEQGEVLRVKKNDASPPEVVTKIDAEITFPRGIVVVGDYLYLALGNAGPGATTVFYRVKKCGGRARLVARGSMPDYGLVAVEGSIYYSNGNELRRFVPSKP